MRRVLVAVIALAVLASTPVVGHRGGGQQGGVFRGRTDGVIVLVSVREKNAPVAGLTPEDFVLIDNGVRQQIVSSNAETLPLDVALVLDTSNSVRGRPFDRLKANIQAISQLLNPADRVQVITFGDRVADPLGIKPGGAPLPLDSIAAGGYTSFYNALAAALMLAPHADRPRMIFSFSDGFDTASFLDARQLVAMAGYSSASLYATFVLRYPDVLDLARVARPPAFAPKPPLPVPVPNRASLQEAASMTGGALYDVSNDDSMVEAFRKVLQEFRSSYVLTYVARDVAPDGWHNIVVTVPGKPNASVRARRGYEARGNN